MPGSIDSSETFAQQIKQSLERNISEAVGVCRYYAYKHVLFFPNTCQPHLRLLTKQTKEFILLGAYELFGATQRLLPELKILIFSFLLGYREAPKNNELSRSMSALFTQSAAEFRKNMARHNEEFGSQGRAVIWEKKLNF